MAKVIVKFKGPDAIWEIINGQHPLPENEDDISLIMEAAQDRFSSAYFEWGDSGRIEIDTETLAARLLPRSEWK